MTKVSYFTALSFDGSSIVDLGAHVRAHDGAAATAMFLYEAALSNPSNSMRFEV